MSKSVKMELPWPPSVNHYWRSKVIIKNGRTMPIVYVAKKGKAYQKAVRGIINTRWPHLRPTEKRVIIVITAIMPDRRKRDLDNILKAAKDALTHAGFWADDSLVDVMPVIRGHVEKPGRLEVVVAVAETVEKLTIYPESGKWLTKIE